MTYKYGIDFGTTNSSIAIRFVGDDKLEHTLVADVKNTLPRETLPSVVLIDYSGKVYAGVEAIDRFSYSSNNSGKQLYIKQIKLDLETKGNELLYTFNGTNYSGVDLIAQILKSLRVQIEKIVDELDIDVSGVVMGVPVQYGDIQKNILKKALVKAGYYSSFEEADNKTEFVSEPIAVAIHYGYNLKNDKTIMVFDFGGGTLDLAVINLKKQINNDKLHPHKTLAKERITLGGEELTRLFFINSFCSSNKYGTKRIAAEFGFRHNITNEQLWEKLLSCEDGIKFINAVERCKCELSQNLKFKFSFIGANIQFDEITFYRDDFTNAIEEKLDEITELVNVCLEHGNISDPFNIDKVILAGGSSLIPAVQNLLMDIFGSNRVSNEIREQDSMVKKLKRSRVSESEVLTSIVRGLAIVGCREEELINDVVDNDYGVWDGENNEFIPIIKRGIYVKETIFNKLTKQGKYQLVECLNKNASSVEVLVYQHNLNGYQKLGTINIPNPGGMRYKIYMQIDKKKGTLTVTLYDEIYQRWIDEVPLSEREYNLR